MAWNCVCTDNGHAVLCPILCSLRVDNQPNDQHDRHTTLGGLGTGGAKWMGIAFAPTTGMLYGAPYNAGSVLTINPTTNTTDTTMLGGLGIGGSKWQGIAFAPTTGMLYCASAYATSVLIINPTTNTTDTTTLGGLGVGGDKWRGIAFTPTTGMLYGAPNDAAPVLLIGWSINPAVLEPFRLISQLSRTINLQNTMIAAVQSDSESQLSAINSLQTTLSTRQNTIASLQSSNLAQQSTISSQDSTVTALQMEALTRQSAMGAQSSVIATLESVTATQSTTIISLQSSDQAQQSTISAQSSIIAVLQSNSTSVCSRPLCGDGAMPSNGVCVPECDDLRRRGVSCEPYCDDAPLQSSDSVNNSLTSVIAGVVVGVIIALVVGLVVIRHFARKRIMKTSGNRQALPHKPHIATMYMNPLHQGANAEQLDYEEPIALNSDYIGATGTGSGVALDDERYVAPASLRSGVGSSDYQVFRASGSESDDHYKRFQSAA